MIVTKTKLLIGVFLVGASVVNAKLTADEYAFLTTHGGHVLHFGTPCELHREDNPNPGQNGGFTSLQATFDRPGSKPELRPVSPGSLTFDRRPFNGGPSTLARFLEWRISNLESAIAKLTGGKTRRRLMTPGDECLA